MVDHYPIILKPYPRGFHIITQNVLTHLDQLPHNGILTLFIQHTSAGLTINENADPDVRIDFETYFNTIIKENLPGIVHTQEGPDDMPAHIKASFVGSSVTIPIINHRLALGTWQGIYLCEFRNSGGSRKLVATITT